MTTHLITANRLPSPAPTADDAARVARARVILARIERDPCGWERVDEVLVRLMGERVRALLGTGLEIDRIVSTLAAHGFDPFDIRAAADSSGGAP